jgi:hypothetical protein
MTTQRYIVTKPVKDGNDWWDVRDTQYAPEPNQTVASFWASMPAEINPGQMAYDLCDRLNKRGENK